MYWVNKPSHQSKRKFLQDRGVIWSNPQVNVKLHSQGVIKLEKSTLALYRESGTFHVTADCCMHAHACIQVLWLRSNHMQPQLTYWDGVPVPEKNPGQEAYCSRINGFNLLSTPKRRVCISGCYTMIATVIWFKPVVYWRNRSMQGKEWGWVFFLWVTYNQCVKMDKKNIVTKCVTWGCHG